MPRLAFMLTEWIMLIQTIDMTIFGIKKGNYIPVVHENLINNFIFVNNRIMKMLKKILVILISVLMLCSCASIFYMDYKPVNDYSSQMELLQENFPEVYNLYRNGDIILNEMFMYTGENGEPRVHISYHYR